jgi:hypothetical protein
MRFPAKPALVLLAALPSFAWEGAPHRAMTRAALDSLPPALRALFGSELPFIAQTYCMLPDYYTAMLNYGFRAPKPAPQSLDDVLPFCQRPDRETIHSATWDRHEDLASLIFLYESILKRLYAAAELNRQRMPAMLQALQRKDQPALEALCLTPARTASELLAGSLFTILQFAAR